MMDNKRAALNNPTLEGSLAVAIEAGCHRTLERR
jgi:hypothetical protein